MNTEQKAVDVLAILQWASVTAESVQDRRAVDEARAAVAELIEAASAGVNHDSGDGSLVLSQAERLRLDAALARCKGE